MARQHFVKSARVDIWERGIWVTKTRQRGKNKGKSYNDNVRTQPDPEGDTLLVKKGESYYWCKFKSDASRRISKTPFTSDELRYGRYSKSEWEEKFDDFYIRSNEVLEDEKLELIAEIEEYRDELQERLDNMPQQLQESSVLNERIEILDVMIGDLE